MSYVYVYNKIMFVVSKVYCQTVPYCMCISRTSVLFVCCLQYGCGLIFFPELQALHFFGGAGHLALRSSDHETAYEDLSPATNSASRLPASQSGIAVETALISSRVAEISVLPVFDSRHIGFSTSSDV